MKKIIYTKYSNERAKKYAIRTDILRDQNRQRFVRKTACCPEGEAHIQNIARNYYRLQEQFGQTPISMNRCSVCENGVELEYLQGSTMEEQLDAFLYAKEYDKAETLIMTYCSEIRKVCSLRQFQITDAFREVFGDVILPEGLECAAVTNIDMVFSNVIMTGSWDLIDYEWTFDFPIPVNYVIYRILHYYLDVSEMRRRMKERGLYEKFGIGKDQITAFKQMERHFQTHIEEGHVPVRDMYPDITPGKLFIGEIISKEKIRKKNENLQIFFAADADFSEQQSEYYPIANKGVDEIIPIPAGTRKMRLDPGEFPGLINDLEISYIPETDTVFQYQTNGVLFGAGKILYEKPDPQIILTEIPKEAEALQIRFRIDPVSPETAVTLKQAQVLNCDQSEKIRELEARLQEREDLIREMENTKVWKMYRKIKKTDGKG